MAQVSRSLMIVIFVFALITSFTTTVIYAQLDSTAIVSDPSGLSELIGLLLGAVGVNWISFAIILTTVIGAVNTLKALLNQTIPAYAWPWINFAISMGACLLKFQPNILAGIVSGVIVFLSSWLGWSLLKKGAVGLKLRSR